MDLRGRIHEVIVNFNENEVEPKIIYIQKPPQSPDIPGRIPTLVMEVSNPEVANGPEVAKFLERSDIDVVLIRGFEFNLNSFSTEEISRVAGNDYEDLEVRFQNYQAGDSNLDENGKPIWECKGWIDSQEYQSVKRFAKYQANWESKNKRVGFPIRLAYLNMHVKEKWAAQLEELNRLPSFAKVDSNDFLSYLEYDLVGINTIQMILKVPGVRTSAHQEDVNICAFNINIGPGNTEWFGVSFKYENEIRELCNRKGLGFHNSSWWPTLEDLVINKIPYYRFIQRPGEMVWNSNGCIHWVQCVDEPCNNIAYNIAPITPNQYKISMERTKFNQSKRIKSMVPMLRVTWSYAESCARIGVLKSQELFCLIRETLLNNIQETTRTLQCLEEEKVKERKKGKILSKSLQQDKYCSFCQMELFNLFLLKKNPEKNKDRKTKQVKKIIECDSSDPELYCLTCAKRKKRRSCLGLDFNFVQDRKTEELYRIYKKFCCLYDDPSIESIVLD